MPGRDGFGVDKAILKPVNVDRLLCKSLVCEKIKDYEP
jgi:hypothetical protein